MASIHGHRVEGETHLFLQQQYLSLGWFSNDHYSISVFYSCIEHTNTIMVITELAYGEILLLVCVLHYFPLQPESAQVFQYLQLYV